MQPTGLNPNYPHHQLLLCWLLEEQSRRDNADFFDAEQRRALGYLAAGLKQGSWTEYQKLEQEAHQKFLQLRFNFTTTKQADNAAVLARMTAEWARAFGDPNDPEVKRKIDEAAQVLRLRREQTQRETG